MAPQGETLQLAKLDPQGETRHVSYDVDLDEGDVRYEGELEMKSAELIADWHPFGGGFYQKTP